MGLSDGGRVMARTEPEPIYRIDIVPVEVNFENLPAMQELQECLWRLDAARENAGGLAADIETFGAGAPLADRHTRQQQNDIAAKEE